MADALSRFTKPPKRAVMTLEALFDRVCDEQYQDVRWSSGMWFLEFCEQQNVIFVFKPKNNPDNTRSSELYFVDEQGEGMEYGFARANPKDFREFLKLPPLEVMPTKGPIRDPGLIF